MKEKNLQDKLIILQQWCDKNSTYEKKWYLELFFNRGCEGAIEWGLGLDFGYSRDYILVGHNFFGDTPEVAVDRAIENLNQLLGKKNKTNPGVSFDVSLEGHKGTGENK